MSIAELIAQELTKIPHAACTLQGGYVVLYNGDRRNFPPASIVHESRTKEGHIQSITAEYQDKSRLCFSWCKTNGGKYYVAED